MKDYREVLKTLATKNEVTDWLLHLLEAELSMPNLPMKTRDDPRFWNNAAEFGGWRLQQNTITHHARLLDPDNVRRAWGTMSGMMKAMDRLVDTLHRYDRQEEETRLQIMEELRTLKTLLDMEAITQAEFEEKKKALLDRL